MDEGLSDWEWSAIKCAAPDKVRQLFKDELDNLYRVETILAATPDALMTHLLAYAWRSTTHLASTCRRFWIITKSRAYWALVSKHALRNTIPDHILNQVNFFHRMDDTMPLNLHLRSLVCNSFSITDTSSTVDIQLFYTHKEVKRVFRFVWVKETDKYIIHHFVGSKVISRGVNGCLRTCEFFNFLCSRKLMWIDDIQTGKSMYFYCEVFDPERGLTWYGEPGSHEAKNDAGFLAADEMMPGPNSWGVWK